MSTKLKARLSWMTALFAIMLLTFASPKAAAADDDDPPGRVARLNYIQGAVSFQPAGEPDWVDAVTNRPLTTGDRLWTDRGARAELHTGSATIRLDSNTGFSFLNLDDRTVQMELTEGSLSIRVQRLDRDEIVEVDTPNQAFSILRPGQYRIQASEDGKSTFVMVRNGEGEATGGGENYTLRSGQSGRFTGTDSLYADIYGAGNNDDFDNWGEGRDRHDDRSQSARYVSADVVGYQDLDDYGSWRSDPNYGNVWVPTRVSADWAPYREGHWAWISPWGWTWVDDAPWGYAPFHYGRWVTVGGSWGWVPGPREVRPVYAPALVVFIGGRSDSRGGGGFGANVGWFPLAPREVYVPGYRTSRAYVDRVNVSNTTVNVTTVTNVYNSHVTNNTTNITYANKNVRGGVTAVPQDAFTGGRPVARAAVVVNAQQIAAAPVTSRAEVAPTRNSVLGNSGAGTNRVAQPPAAIVNRTVVAKAPPPAPPVPFARQQQALAAHPGEPLAKHEVETLRPPAADATRPMVKQAPPGKPGTPNTTPPVAANPGQPSGGQPANQPGNKPAGVPAASVPPSPPQPTRGDRPGTAQQNNPPAVSRPGADNAGRPVNSQPPTAPPNTQGNPQRDTQGNRPQPMATDRPASVQPGNPPSNSQPGVNNAGRPVNSQPPTAPPNTQGNPQKDTQGNRPQPMSTDRPASVQPNSPPSSNQPGANNAGRPINSQPPGAATNQPVNPSKDLPVNRPPAFRDNRPPPSPDKTNGPPEPPTRRVQAPEPPAASAQPTDRRGNPPPPPPSKVEPVQPPKGQPNPPLTQAEKDREKQQQEKKREDKPPPQ